MYDEALDAVKPLTETQQERTYPLADYLRALQNAGFEKIEVTDDFGHEPVGPESTRWFFHARQK